MPKTAKNWPIRNSKQGFKWLLASAGYFIQGHGKVCRQPGVRYTYQLHMILRTPEVFRSVACRQPVSSSIRSGRCRRWSRTRARSHCYTDGNGQRAAALVTQAGWHSTHLGVPPPSLPVLKPRENNREGDAAPPPHISSYQGRGREGAFLKRQKAEEHKPDVNRLGKRFSEWAKCSIAAPRGASPCENEGGGIPQEGTWAGQTSPRICNSASCLSIGWQQTNCNEQAHFSPPPPARTHPHCYRESPLHTQKRPRVCV